MGKEFVIGRIVRYCLAASDLPDECQERAGDSIAAIITETHDVDGVASLTGFPPSSWGLPLCVGLPERSIAYPPARGTWHWPPHTLSGTPEYRQARDEKRAKKRKAKAAAAKAAHADSPEVMESLPA